MKRTFLTVIFLGFYLFCTIGVLGALEAEIIGGGNFLTFHPDMKNAYSSPVITGKEFQPYPYGFGNLLIKHDFSSNFGYSFNLVRDNILRNNFEGLFTGKSEYICFKIGPFLGMPDTLENPFLGVLAGIDLTYPGIVFLEISGSATMGSDLNFTSEHIRETAGARLGFWLPSAIPSVSANYKQFKKVDADLTLQDTLIRYMFNIEFYSKSFPMTFRIDAGYQTLKRLYDSKITENYTDEINSVFAGFELRWQIAKKVKILLGAEMPLYCDIKSPATAPELYTMPKATAGIIISGN